jgi:hypothetical protein
MSTTNKKGKLKTLTESVTEDMISNVLLGTTNLVTHYLNNGQSAHVTLKRENRGGNIVISTKVAAHD